MCISGEVFAIHLKEEKKNVKTKCKIKLTFQKHFLISDSTAALSCFFEGEDFSPDLIRKLCMSVCSHSCTKLTCFNGCWSKQWKIKTDWSGTGIFKQLTEKILQNIRMSYFLILLSITKIFSKVNGSHVHFKWLPENSCAVVGTNPWGLPWLPKANLGPDSLEQRASSSSWASCT